MRHVVLAPSPYYTRTGWLARYTCIFPHKDVVKWEKEQEPTTPESVWLLSPLVRLGTSVPRSFFSESMGKLALANQLLGDFPETATDCDIIGELRRGSLLALFALGEVFPTHALDLGRGCHVERRLRTLFGIYSHGEVEQYPYGMHKAFHAVVKIGGNCSGMESIDRDTRAFEPISQFVGKVDLR